MMRVGRRTALGGMLAAAALGRAAFAGEAAHRVRFLDPAGDDWRDGTSPETAWRSLEAAAELPDGATLLLRRGATWRGALSLGGAVAVGAYGEGERPVILGSDAPGALARAGSIAGGALWVARLDEEPLQVLLAGSRALRVAAPADLVVPGRWHWADGRLTLASSGEGPPQVQAGTRRVGLELRDAAEARIQSLDLRHAAFGIDADRALSCTIADCRFDACYVNAVSASSAEGRRLLVVQGCEAVDTGGVGIGFGGRIDRVLIDGNVVRRAGRLTERAVGSSGLEARLEWTAGIKNWGWGGAGWQGEVAITRNLVEGCGPQSAPASPGQGIGIWIDEVVAPRSRQLVAWNRVRGCASRGIYIEKSDDVDVDYNHVQDCAAVEGTGALALQANMYGYDVAADAPALISRDCRNNRLRHNTVVGGAWSLEAHARDPGCRMTGNLVEDNIMVTHDGERVTGARLLIAGGAANDLLSGAGNAYLQNSLGPAFGQRLEWGGRVADDAATLTHLSEGSFTALPDVDPLLVDAAGGDVRLSAISACRSAARGRPRDHDLAGRPIPMEARADLGCLQYAGAG